jgi:peptidoglycan/LPS O-acetylase OafA/YrhL
MSYRSDIDGLRAVSVAAVIAFHLGGSVPGGFTGVDVFFVISGFLIGSIVLEQTNAGTFSFLSFYERRARRIWPSLLVTIVLSFCAATALLTSRDVVTFAKSAIAALLFVPNIFFYTTNDYFGIQSSETPLLHLWSLGVEEQFYIVFPIVAVLLARLRRAWLTVTLVGLGLISLACSQGLLAHDAPAAFYLIHSRAFELIIGILLAHAGSTPRSRLTAEAISLLGCGLLAISFLVLSEAIPFPGAAALPPCAAAAAIIWSGGYGTTLSYLLATRPMVYLGRISYPLYLAHWPIFVFLGIAHPEWGRTKIGLIALALTFIGAALSYHLVQAPIRFGRSPRRRLAYVALCGLAFAAAPILAIATSGFEWRLDARSRELLASTDDPQAPFRRRECFLDPDQGFSDFNFGKCLLYSRPQLLIWGDSHAAHYYFGFSKAFDGRYTVSQLTASACPPIVGYKVKDRPHCTESNDRIAGLIKDRRPDIIVLSAMWKAFHPEALRQTLRQIAPYAGRVVVLGNTPVFAEPVPRYLTREHAAPIQVQNRGTTEDAMDKLLDGDMPRNITYLPLIPLACPEDSCAIQSADGTPYYFDEGHLTPQGSLWLVNQVAAELKRVEARATASDIKR